MTKLYEKLQGNVYGTYTVCGYKFVQRGGKVWRDVLLVCECGVSKDMQPTLVARGKVYKCGCQNETGQNSKAIGLWEEEYEKQTLEQLECIDQLKRRKRERELAKLKSNITAMKSEKMQII